MHYAFKATAVAVVLTLGLGVSFDTRDGVSFIEDAYARMSSSRSFSSRSVSVSSYKSSSRSKSSSWGGSKTKAKATKSKSPSVARKASKPKPTPFTKAAARNTSKQNAKKFNSKFKKPVSAQTRTKTIASMPSSTRGRLNNVNRSTYYQNRETTMTSYRSRSSVDIVVIQRGSPSYGPYSSWYYWDVAMTDPMYGYHHRHDPYYNAWRSEARELARENKQLEQQLAAHDALAANGTGDANPDYIPAGVDKDVIFAPEYVEATNPEFRLCTALPTGKYFEAGIQVRNLVNKANVKVISTAGSVQNLAMLASGECDGAYVQRDAFAVYNTTNPDSKLAMTRLGSMYKEPVHLFCSIESNISLLEDLNGRNDIAMYVGADGSGSSVTWGNFNTLTDELADISVVHKAASDATFGAANHCGIYVGFAGSDFMKAINTKGKVRMIDIESVPTDEILDPDSKPVYETAVIGGDTYKKIQTGWNDMGFGTATDTVETFVDFVVTQTFRDSQKTSQAIMDELVSVGPTVANSL